LNQAPSLELLSVAKKWFVLPITILTLVIVTFRAMRRDLEYVRGQVGQGAGVLSFPVLRGVF
jgi:hypothetical protein